MSTRDSAVFKRVMAKVHELKEGNQLSIPDGPGSMSAVLMPFHPDVQELEPDAWEYFEQDAEELERDIVARGRIPVMKMRATPDDFRDVFTNRSIASVTIRALGNFSLVYMPSVRQDGEPTREYDWRDLAKVVDHLKQGPIKMRSCGMFRRRFNPPFALGAVSSHTHIWGAPNRSIYPVGLDESIPDNKLILPITDSDELSYADVKRLFPDPALERGKSIPGIVPDSIYLLGRHARDLAFGDHHGKRTRMPGS